MRLAMEKAVEIEKQKVLQRSTNVIGNLDTPDDYKVRQSIVLNTRGKKSMTEDQRMQIEKDNEYYRVKARFNQKIQNIEVDDVVIRHKKKVAKDLQDLGGSFEENNDLDLRDDDFFDKFWGK